MSEMLLVAPVSSHGTQKLGNFFTEPDLPDTELCGAINKDGEWKSSECSLEKEFACKLNTSEFPPLWIAWTGELKGSLAKAGTRYNKAINKQSSQRNVIVLKLKFWLFLKPFDVLCSQCSVDALCNIMVSVVPIALVSALTFLDQIKLGKFY